MHARLPPVGTTRGEDPPRSRLLSRSTIGTMSQRHRTPEPLRARVFSRAEAFDKGLTSNQLRATNYDRVSRGIWQAPGADSSDGDARAQLLRLLPAMGDELPDHALSHQSAALLWGMRLPPRLQLPGPVHVTRMGKGPRVKRPGFMGHRATNSLMIRRHSSGLAVTGPTRTLTDIAGLLSEIELICVVDGVICTHLTGVNRDRPAQRSIEDLHRDLDLLRGTRGVAKVRRALERARVGSDSAPETRLRLELEDAGARSFQTDLEIRGADGFPVNPDLGDPRARVSVQYEGQHHDERGQRGRDIRRLRATEEAGWTEVRIFGADLDVQVSRRGRRISRAVALVLEALEAKGF